MALLNTLASLVALEVNELTARVRKNAVVYGVLAFFALVAVVFLLVALNVALTGIYGPLWAPLIIAGVGIVCALIVYIAYASMEARAKRREEAAKRLAAERSALVSAAATTALPLLTRSPGLLRLALPIGAAVATYFLLMRENGSNDTEGPSPP